MAVTRTNSTIAAPITGTLLLNGLRVAMENAGFDGRIDEYTSASETRDIYRTDYGTGLTYSQSFLETRVNTSTLVVSAALYWSWVSSTNTGSANPAVTASNMTVSVETSVNFVALNGGHEFRAVIIIQGLTVGVLQLVRPSLGRPSWWTDKDYPYFFLGANVTGANQWTQYNSTGGTALAPFGTTLQRLRPVQLQGVTPTGQRQVLTNPQLESNSGTNLGVLGQFSADLGQCSGTNALILDPIEIIPGANEWLILHPTTGGLTVRII